MTNEQMAARLEKRAAQAKSAGTPVWIDEDDEAAVLAGANALREVDRLRGTIRDIYAIVCEELAEPPSGTGPLVRIGTLIEEHGGDTPDPRDTRIAELEGIIAKARNVSCAYCQHVTMMDGLTGEQIQEAVTAHIVECDARPEKSMLLVLSAILRHLGVDLDEAPKHRPDFVAGRALEAVDILRARIAELEATLRGIWDLREKTERTYEDAYKSMFKCRGEAEWEAVEVALKEVK